MKNLYLSYLLRNCEDYFSWLNSYYLNLKEIKKVFTNLELGSKELVFAIDFFDLLNFAFPYLQIPIVDVTDDNSKDKFVLDYLARSYVIEHNNIKKIFLPPYIEEFNNYLSSFQHFVNDSISSASHELKMLLNKIFIEKTIKSERIKIINKNFKILNKYLMSVYKAEDGLGILKSLFDENEKNKISYINDLDIDQEIILQVLEKEAEEIFHNYNTIRKNKIYQNLIDSKAIQIVNDLNKHQNKYSIYYVSGASSTKAFFHKYTYFNDFLSLDLFKTLIYLTYKLDNKDPKYNQNIINEADLKLEEIEQVYGKDLEDFKELIDSCQVLLKKIIICDNQCSNYQRCSRLILEDNLKRIKEFKENNENIKYILKGIIPSKTMESIFVDKFDKLEELNKLISEENKTVFESLNHELESQFKFENFIFWARILPSIRKLDIKELEEFNDFPFYIYFKESTNYALQILINDIQQIINDKNNDGLNEKFIELVKLANSIQDDEAKWLVWLLVFFAYRKFNLIIDFYENYYIGKNKKDDVYKNEVLFIYLKTLWEIVDELTLDPNNSINEVGNLIRKINYSITSRVDADQDPRFKWLQILTAGLFYESDRLHKNENILLSIFGKQFSMRDNELISRIDELIEFSNQDNKYTKLVTRFIMNKAYLLSLSGVKDNLLSARKIMEDNLGFPNHPKKEQWNYKDTYAFILMSLGLVSENVDDKRKLLTDALNIFQEILPLVYNPKSKDYILNGISKCQNSLALL